MCWRRTVALALALTAALAAPQPAGAWPARPESLLSSAGLDGPAWEAQPVRGPVAPADVAGRAPYVPDGAARSTGSAVQVGPDAGAAFYLSALEVARVVAPAGAQLRFTRVRPGMRVEDPGVPAGEGRWLLAEPAGGGSVWLVTAAAPVAVRVERPRADARGLGGERVRIALRAWVEGRGPLPTLPGEAELRARLQRDAELEATLVQGGSPALARAARAWRTAAALQAWERVEGLTSDAFRVRHARPAGPRQTPEGLSTPYARADGASGEWTLRASAPGVVAVHLRPVVSAGGGAAGARVLEVREGDRLLVRRELAARPARVDGEAAALPGEARPRRLTDAEWAGIEEEVRLPVPQGGRTLTVHWEGGPVLVRARLAERRPWLGEALAGEADWHAWARQAAKAVEQETSAGAGLLRLELARLEAAAAPGAPALQGLSPVLAAHAALAHAEAPDARDAAERLARAAPALAALGTPALAGDGALAWDARLRAAALALEAGQPTQAHALLAASDVLPSHGWQLAGVAEVLGRLPRTQAVRSRALAALELAWRREPLAGDVRLRYHQAWDASARWALAAPTRASATELPAQRWLDLDDAPAEAEGAEQALWPLEAGAAPVMVQAQGSARAPEVLRALVLPGEAGPSALRLKVGAEDFALVPMAGVEPVEVALPSGTHAVGLDGPAGARAFLSLRPVSTQAGEAGAPVARVHQRTHWPVLSGGRAVRFPIPDAQLPTPVRVMLRAAGAGAPRVVRLHTDVGPVLRLEVQGGAPDRRHVSLELGTPGPAPVAAVVVLPAGTREVWFEAEGGGGAAGDAPLLASVSVRRDEAAAEAAEPAQLPAVPERPYEALRELTRALDALAPDAVEAAGPRLDRAALLLALGEEELARADLGVLLARATALPAAEAGRLRGLAARLEADGARAVRFTAAPERPTLLSPAFPLLDGARAPGTAALARSLAQGGDAADAGSPAERYLRARALAARGELQPAALALVGLYRAHPLPQLGLEALGLLEQLQLRAPESARDVAPLAAALAGQLQAWADHPRAARARRAAAALTRWERLRDVEAGAGSREAQLAAAPDEPAQAVRKALLAPPWPLEEARLLPAGVASVLELTLAAPETLGAQAVCRPWGSAARAAPRPCRFELRLDGATVARAEAQPGQAVLLEARAAAAGRHQLELALVQEADGAGALGAARFVRVPAAGGDPTALSTRQPLSLLRSVPGRPVVVTVLGPTALRVSARSAAPGAGRPLLLRSERLADRASPAADAVAPLRLGVPAEADPTVQGSPLGAAGEAVLLLPEPGPHRVALEAPEGEVLVHVSMGVGQARAAAQAPLLAARELPAEAVRWPAQPPPLAPAAGTAPDAAAGPAAGRLGTLSAGAGWRQEDFEEGELVDRAPRTGLEVAATYRRQLLEEGLWLRAGADVRRPSLDGAGVVTGARLGFYAARLPGGLRLNVNGSWATQALEGGSRWSARGTASLNRFVPLSPDWALLPALVFSAEQQGGSGTDLDAYDQSVFWRFGENHPRRLTPRLALRWQPFQEHVGTLHAWGTSNADLGSFDHVGSALRWSALLGGPLAGVRAGLGYELSYRLVDDHRGRAYLRHGARAQLDRSVWTGTAGRLVLYAEDRLLGSAPYGLQNIFGVGLRYDWSGGRGLQDFSPPEEDFSELLESGRFRP